MKAVAPSLSVSHLSILRKRSLLYVDGEGQIRNFPDLTEVNRTLDLRFTDDDRDGVYIIIFSIFSLLSLLDEKKRKVWDFIFYLKFLIRVRVFICWISLTTSICVEDNIYIMTNWFKY